MLCHDSKTIFVHIPKNAGQSIERVFLNRLGLTWATRAPLLLRKNGEPELGPPRLAHLKAREYVAMKYVPQAMFDDYFKFTFVRNPWDRAVSFYKYLVSSQDYDFKTFLSNVLTEQLWTDMHWFVGPQAEYVLGEDGQMLVDFVGRFEHLQDGFDEVCNQIGIPPTPLPYVNKSKSEAPPQVRPGRFWDRAKLRLRPGSMLQQHEHYRDYYDEESHDLLSRLYSTDIDTFGYTFD